MPNQRAAGQKLLTLPSSEGFIAAIDASLLAIGYSNRSKFIRDAVAEKLKRHGIHVPHELYLSPPRTKKRPPTASSNALAKKFGHDTKKQIDTIRKRRPPSA